MIASEVDADLLIRAKSQFYVGVCHELQNERRNAKQWYEDAYTSASQLAAQWQGRPQRLAQLQPFMNTLSQVLRAHGSTLGVVKK